MSHEVDSKVHPASTLEGKGAPWNPRGIALITFFFSILPGGILHALNYERLGRSELKRNNLITNTLSAVALVVAALTFDLPRLLIFVINVGYAIYFQISQESLFRQHLAGGGKKASLVLPGAASLLSLVPLLTLMLVLGNSYQVTHFERQFGRAVQLLKDERYAEAEQMFKECQEYYPEDTAIYWNLAIVYHETGRIDEAKGQLERLLEIDEDADDAKDYLEELTEEQFTSFVTESFDYLTERQDALRVEFKIGEHESWEWDQASGELIFSDHGKPVVVAKIQFVGSISTQSNSWLWSWDNPNVMDHLKVDSRKVMEFGAEKGYQKLTSAKWEAGEADGWDMTAIAAYVVKAKGAYRTPTDTGFAYFLVKDISWVE